MEGPGRETKDGREQQHDSAGRGVGRGGHGSPSLNDPLGLGRRGAADRLGTMHGGGRFASTPDSRVGEYRGQGTFSL